MEEKRAGAYKMVDFNQFNCINDIKRVYYNGGQMNQ